MKLDQRLDMAYPITALDLNRLCAGHTDRVAAVKIVVGSHNQHTSIALCGECASEMAESIHRQLEKCANTSK